MSEQRPLVTLALACYNHERYVRSAAQALLTQTYSPAEVILSDDCSSDQSFEIIKEVASSYRGPHRIRLNRNECNVGTGAHTSRLLAMARGTIFVGSASDDVSEPHRAAKLVEVFQSNPRAQCVWSNALIIDGDGRDVRLFADPEFRGNGDEGSRPLSSVVRGPWTLGATAVYRMSVWNVFGPMMEGIAQEDAAMAWRCRLLGDIHYIPDALVKYRQHGANLFDYQTRSVATALGEAKAKAGRKALRRQALKDLKTARSRGLLGRRAFIYYALANRQRYLADDMMRWATNQSLSGWRADLLRWAVEQPKRAMRAVDGRITQKILLSKS